MDYQGSAELIPTAGPDAASEQGPAIKAVWEPAPPSVPGRRQSRRAGEGQRSRENKRRGTLVAGALAAVAVAAVGFVGLSGGDKPGPAKGSAATYLPDASASATANTGQSGSGSNGTDVSLPNGSSPARPTASASASPSASASA
ncbi:MAG: hypothetical protein ACRDSS_09180, partial [Actinocrinis sp.]